MDNLDHLLARCQTLHDFDTLAFFRYFGDKFLDNSEIDVSLQKGQTDLPHHVLDVLFCDAGFTAHFRRDIL